MSTPRVSSRSTAGADDEAKEAPPVALRLVAEGDVPLPPFAVHFVKPVFVYGKDQSRPTSLMKYREDDAAMRGTPYRIDDARGGIMFGFAPMESFVPWSNIACCGRGL